MAVLGVVAVVVLVFGGVQVFARGTPALTYSSTVPAVLHVPGPAPVLPFPAQGEATVGVLGVGTIGSSGGDGPVPIASLTKIMTAYLILAEHPLSEGQQGPLLTVTAADVAAEAADAAGSQSVVAVSAGEQLSEMQALEALLVGSANNIATLLADWDAGSVSAFVAKMNTEAAKLGMKETRYADPTGVLPTTVSSADDQVTLAARAMANPVFAGIVGLPQINLPVAGTVFNYDYLVGHDGIIGIKTGSTSEAGGCFVFAALRSVGGAPTIVIGAVLGQQGPSILQAALNASLALADAAAASLRTVSVSVPDGGVVGSVSAPWTGSVPVGTQASWSTLGWGGMPVGVDVTHGELGQSLAAGARIGTVTFTIGPQRRAFPVSSRAPVPSAPLSWKLKRL